MPKSRKRRKRGRPRFVTFKGRRYRCVDQLPRDAYHDALDDRYGDDDRSKVMHFIEAALAPGELDRLKSHIAPARDRAELKQLVDRLNRMYVPQMSTANMNRAERRAAKRLGRSR